MPNSEHSSVIRRLAAIVVADVVGYTRLMERDDTGTFSRLRTIRDEVVDSAIVSHGGRIVKTAGDGLVAEFASALSALRAAVHIQREMAGRNASVPAGERIEYRIGINLGDIMVESNDIAGDGVNVASRLEALAEPGGICVSSSVREQVHGTLDIAFDDIGDQRVKNIARPIRAFAVRLGGANALTASSGAVPGFGAVASAVLARQPIARWAVLAVVAGAIAFALVASRLHLWPFRGDAPPAPPAMSVGVMPLVASGGDATTTQRLESLTRDLSAQLARADVAIRTVPVTARQSSATNSDGTGELGRGLNVRYILEGDAQLGHEVSVIRLRLVSAASGEQIWNETLSLKDATADHTRSVRRAMDHLRTRLWDVEIRRAAATPERATSAMDYVLRALALDKEDKSLERFRRQEALYEEALRLDPDLVVGLLGLYYTLDGQLDVDSKVDRERLVRQMDEVTSRAVNLDRTAPQAWDARSGALMYMGRWDAALEASGKAIQLDPDAAFLLASRAWLMSMAGRPAEAAALVAQAIAMDPPGSWWTIRVGCEAYLLLGQYEQAIAACEKATGQVGVDFDIAYFLAAAYAHTGSAKRAAEETAKILRVAPGFTIATLRAKRYSTNPEYMRLAEAHWYSGLRKAGIPEQ